MKTNTLEKNKKNLERFINKEKIFSIDDFYSKLEKQNSKILKEFSQTHKIFTRIFIRNNRRKNISSSDIDLCLQEIQAIVKDSGITNYKSLLKNLKLLNYTSLLQVAKIHEIEVSKILEFEKVLQDFYSGSFDTTEEIPF